LALSKHRVAVIGGGSFGTAIANIIASNGHATHLWMRNPTLAEEINAYHQNSDYLPGLPLSPQLEAGTDLVRAVKDADLLFVAVPSHSFRAVTREFAGHIRPDAYAISATKGIETEDFRLMSQVLGEELNGQRIGVLSGPNLAKEIASGGLTATVVASQCSELNATVQALLHSKSFRVYASSDMYGVELGGALKNVYAIMAGLGAALGLGQNAQGMLITRSLAEMSRFAVQLGANPLTFLGLSGVGDLIVTCGSPLSRNYRVGYALGEGQALDEIIADLGQVAEGVNTLKTLKLEADRRSVYMPLVNGLYDLLYARKNLAETLDGLMLAEQSDDVEFSVSE
jgi:glycerol-3-phosphate dehydrogenase (NAD(P)+)